MPSRRFPSFALAAVLALAGGACGDGDSPTVEGPAEDTSEATTTTGAGATPTTTGTAGDGTKVDVKGFAFVPQQMTVKVGATVTWTQQDDTTHTITADDGSFDSGNRDQGSTFSHTFDKAGTFAYHCSIHSSMTGSVTVQ